MVEVSPPASPVTARAPPVVAGAHPPLPTSPNGAASVLPQPSDSLTPTATAAMPGSATSGTIVQAGASAKPAADTASSSTALADPSNPNSLNSMDAGRGAYGGGYGSGYGGGYGVGYGGMDPFMSGMGGLYGMGGLGMMGMGGMGMMGMGMYGMTPEAQRSQMMMFMISRMVELWGMFSNVVQMTLGSAIQFAGNYVGINQRLGQVDELGMTQEENYLRSMRAHRAALMELPESERDSSRHEHHAASALREKKQQRRPSFLRTLMWSTLRHLAILIIAYVATRKVGAWYAARQKAKEISRFAADSAVQVVRENHAPH